MTARDVTLSATAYHHGRAVSLSMTVEWWGCDHAGCMATKIPEANPSPAYWTASDDGTKHWCPRHPQESP